jgi:hypothetical protein
LKPDVDPGEGKIIYHPLLLNLGLTFGVVLTIIGLLLDMIGEKFTGAISGLFIKDPRVLSGVAYVVVANVLVLIIFTTVGTDDTYKPRFSMVLSVLVVNTGMAALLPYMSYIFFFLDPTKVVTRIVMEGLKGVIHAVQDKDGDNVQKHQLQALDSMEQLAETAMRAVRKVCDKVLWS